MFLLVENMSPPTGNGAGRIHLSTASKNKIERIRMTHFEQNQRYKHTGSTVLDFVYVEHFNHEARILTITADDFDSAAFADVIVRHRHVIAFEDETSPCAPPAWSVVAVIAGARFYARVVRQRLYGKPSGVGVTVRLTPIPKTTDGEVCA